MGLETWTYAPNKSPADLTGLEYTEARGSQNIQSSPGNTQITRIYYCDYSVLPSFLDDLLGFSVYNATFSIERVLPDQHPLYTAYFAMEASVEGVGVLGKNDTFRTPDYTIARVTAQYRPPNYWIKADAAVTSESQRFVSRSQNVAGDYYTINPMGMKFVSASVDKVSIQQPPAKVTGIEEWTYVWYWIPAKSANPFINPNRATVVSCLGRVNTSIFDTSGINAPVGTMLFLGCEPKMVTQRITTGPAALNYYWELTYKFLYRNNGSGSPSGTAGHNYIYNQTTGLWTLITDDGTATGKPLYELADLNQLFVIS